MRFKLTVEYDGTAYCGWQIQPGEATIQGTLEAAAERLFGVPARVAAAGRTDSGVHAAGQVVSFQSERAMDAEVVCRALNALTPPDIAIRSVEVVGDDFDPRRMATSRAYVYRIWNERTPNVFWRRYSWHVPRSLDVAAMASAAAAIVGEHDFTAFRAAGCDAASPVRRVYRSAIRRDGSLIIYEVEATAFLRHMVRTIIGTLVDVGLGDRRSDEIAALLASRDRSLAGATAPPHGLCLASVSYGGRGERSSPAGG